MKLIDMPNGPILNTILNAAQHVLAQSDDMDHMLQKVDLLLSHEFEDTRLSGKRVVEALRKGNGISSLQFCIEPGGTIVSSYIKHDLPRNLDVTDDQLIDIEKQLYAMAFPDVDNTVFTKRTCKSWFLEYSAESLK
nr:MAG TPA: hypothetical protein [Caudoviricetes sp.]